MQELVIDRIEEKTPRAGGSPFYAVYGQGGEDMTTRDPTIKDLAKGTRINVEPVVQGRHVNIARWELIEAAQVSPDGAQPGADKRDTDGLRTELASNEARTAFNGIIELVKADKLAIEDPKAAEALEWGKAKIAATMDGLPPSLQYSLAGIQPKAPEFPNIGALLSWCSKLQPPVTHADFLEIVGVKESELPKVDIDTAFQLIKDHLAAKKGGDYGQA